MSAAAALAEKGFHVTLCEERPNLGGRVSSVFNNVRQEWVDNGPHVLLSCYNNFCIFLDRIGARKKIKFQKHLAITFLERGAKKRRFYGMPLPSPLDFISGIFFYSPLDIKDKIKALNVIAKIGSDPIKGMTVMSWLDTLGQSEKAKKYLWYPLAVGVLNENPEDASALLFRNVLIAISKPSSLRMLIGVRVGYATVPFAMLFEPEFTGFMNMHRGKIRLNCRINALETNDGKITGAITVKGERIVSDYYVVCVPPDKLVKLAVKAGDGDRNTAYEGLFSPIVSSHLVFGGQAPDIDSACLLDGHFQWLFNYSRLWRTKTALLSLVKSAASDLVDKDNKEILDLALNDIKNFLPEMSKAKLLHHVVIREKHATITAGARGWGPGASNSLTTWAGGGINNLFIAGDWVEQELPSTIESAAKSGHAAANAVRESNEHI